MQRFTLFPKDKFMNSQSDEQTDEGNAEKWEEHTDTCQRKAAARAGRPHETQIRHTTSGNNAAK